MGGSNDLGIGKGLWLKSVLAAGVLFLLAPLGMLVLFSFNASSNITVWGGFSLQWYQKAFHDPNLWLCVRNSLLVAVGSTVISTVLGALAALSLGKLRFRGRDLLRNLVHVPILLPEIVLGIGLLVLFQLIRLPLGLVSVTIAHVTFSLSYVTIIILASVRNLDPSVEQAALDLGARPVRAFFDVVLPDIAAGVTAGALFAFCLSIDDFVVTFFTTGSGFSTFPLKVYSMLKYGVDPSINAVSTLLVLVTCAAIAGAGLLTKHRERLAGRMRGLIIGLAALTIGALAFLFLAAPPAAKRVVFATYSDYMDESILRDFRQETGIEVVPTYVNDGNELLAKLQAGASDYDLLLVTDHLVGIMGRQGLLDPYDFRNVPRLDNVPAEFRRLDFDPSGALYVPYTYGITAIVYNADKVKGPVDSWNVFLDPAYRDRTTLIDEMRQAFSVAYLLLGYSINDTDPVHLAQARDLMVRMKGNLRKYEGNLAKDMMRGGESWIAQIWSGEILRLNREDPKFRLGLPREGCPMFVDTLCLRHGSERKAEAEAFVNYLLRPDIAARNMNLICYAMPNVPARKLLPAALRDSPILFPPLGGGGRFQGWKDIGPFTRDLHRAWMEVKGE